MDALSFSISATVTVTSALAHLALQVVQIRFERGHVLLLNGAHRLETQRVDRVHAATATAALLARHEEPVAFVDQLEQVTHTVTILDVQCREPDEPKILYHFAKHFV